ncbi:peptide chain release factor N(5)-glutamine methyltransferase [Haloimpatiens sp. FM7315]|uniref:peptide chain release factor N(5)-glutamine methyltransferase n=1 Tax=Haloimpatiens sp. FM7315 TaxID=3298609 RepID=UPI0035A3D506
MKISELLNRGYSILKEVHIDSYIIDTQLLLCKALDKDKLYLIMNREVEVCKEAEMDFFRYLDIRKKKMPIKYILESCEFMGIDFYVREGVLIPRPDTEILVEESLRLIKENNYKSICDVCCGSGVIGLSIAKIIKNVTVLSSDISSIAKEVTEKNIEKLGVESRVKFFMGDLLEMHIKNNKKFDMVISNPPYIEKNVIETLMEDVKNYEPYIALCGGEDGLDFYKKITEQSQKVLNKNGFIAFEIGYNQKRQVEKILKDNGFTCIRCIKDLAGLDRALIGKYSL